MDLTKDDIEKKMRGKVFVQDYTPQPKIEGVLIKELKNFVGEDGDFTEILRLTHEGEVEGFPAFHIRQINRSKMLPGAIKAWHLHYEQEEIQTVVPEHHLIIGLWDVREKSPTKNMTMKLVFGGGRGHLLYIPKGVAHGYMNVSPKPATVLYFMNKQFDLGQLDERRLPWDSVKGFWEKTHE